MAGKTAFLSWTARRFGADPNETSWQWPEPSGHDRPAFLLLASGPPAIAPTQPVSACFVEVRRASGCFRPSFSRKPRRRAMKVKTRQRRGAQGRRRWCSSC